jgi:hypothetical protein
VNKPTSFWLSNSCVINEVDRAPTLEGLNWAVLMGATEWSVHADFPDGSVCLAYVETSREGARFSDTRELVQSWLKRQEDTGNLVIVGGVAPRLTIAKTCANST